MKFATLRIWLLLSLLLSLGTLPFLAQCTTQNLADTINDLNVTEDSEWSAVYSQFLSIKNASAFDDVAISALEKRDYKQVLYITLLAEKNNYWSSLLEGAATEALNAFPMKRSLPVTYYSEQESCFLLYDRYLIDAYKVAERLNVTRWNIIEAWNTVEAAYLYPPINSYYGEMLWINLETGKGESFSSRYYDEFAETLSLMQRFALAGIENAVKYTDDMWFAAQNLWNGAYYSYSLYSEVVECEMANFAQIISEYKNFRGVIPFYDRVIKDLEYKLLNYEFESPAWGQDGVVRHAENNQQLRLSETLSALVTLHMLYPNFSSDNQINFRSILSQGWPGLVDSQLYNPASRSFRWFGDENCEYNSEATNAAAIALFLYGIEPNTAYLVINASEIKFNDYRSCFPLNWWNFNYANRSIRIPVTQGTLSFHFGNSAPYMFAEDGVYDITFSDDWSIVTEATKIANVTFLKLEKAEIQALNIERPYISQKTENNTTSESVESLPKPQKRTFIEIPVIEAPLGNIAEINSKPLNESEVHIGSFAFMLAICVSCASYLVYKLKQVMK